MAVHQWAATTMRALTAQLDGSFEEAERLANEALSLQPGRPNVQFTHLDQMALLRWEQGRLGEQRDEWQGVVDRFPRAAFARAWLSLADAELGRSDDARSGLRALAEQIPRRPRDGIWLPAVALASLLSARLNEPEAAGTLYSMLLPYARHIVAFTAPQPVVCLGSGAFYLGLLATVMSRWAEAAGHFQAAIGAHERLGARSFLARTRYQYARMLLCRGQPADQSMALGLLDRALPTASTLGMAAVAEGIQALRAAHGSETPPVPPAHAGAADAEVSGNLFRREGEYWTVRYEGSVARLKDAKGLRYLARLLADPGREYHAADLAAAGSPAARPAPSEERARAASELHVRPDLGDAGELLDAQAKAAYKARLGELAAELDEAERFSDPGRAAKASAERDFLVDELARAVGLGGRDRRAASHAERARLNVTRAIRAAMANLARANPLLGQHLSATIRTGRYCSYIPDPRAPITWEL
jgi:tetratricopeptide (TPR) repeat protein